MNSQSDPPPHITLCSESFWPQFDSYSWWTGDFCRLANPTDLSLRVVTTRPTKENPEVFDWHGVKVERILSKPVQLNWFGSTRLLRMAITSGPRNQCLLINQSPSKALTILNLAKRLNAPTMLRVPEVWLETEKTRKKSEQVLAVAKQMGSQVHVVFPTEEVQKQLGASDLKNGSIVPEGVITIDSEYANDLDPLSIRSSLSKAHPIFEIESDQPLALVASHFGENKRIKEVVIAWNQVRRRYPRARLWIVGYGSKAREVWDTICKYELTVEVIMPGCFDQIQDLFHAADLFIECGGNAANSLRFLKLAIASGTPSLVEKRVAESVIESQANHVTRYPHDSATDLANRLIPLISGGVSTTKAVADRSVVAQNLHFRETVVRYTSILKSLVENAGRRS